MAYIADTYYAIVGKDGDIAGDADSAFKMVKGWVENIQVKAAWNPDTIMDEIAEKTGYYDADVGYVSATSIFDAAADVIGSYGNPGAAELAEAIRNRRGTATVESGHEKAVVDVVIESSKMTLEDVGKTAKDVGKGAWSIMEWWGGLTSFQRKAIGVGAGLTGLAIAWKVFRK